MSVSARETVGKLSLDLQKKTDEKINPIDMQRQMHKGNKSEDSFENQVELAVKSGKKDFDGDFFVVVLFKKERLLRNVIRQYFFTRESCPTPSFDQIVYKYFRTDSKLDFLWVVPDKQTVIDMVLIGHELPKEQQDLVQFARDFNSGKLLEQCDMYHS